MKLGKVLRNTALASAIAVLAFAGNDAFAGNGGDGTGDLSAGVFQAHVGASVIGATHMVEHDPVSFGNISVPPAGGSMDLTPAGVRQNATGIVPLNGNYATSGGATDSSYGAARAGFYTITGDPGAIVYITYFNGTGGVGNAGVTPIGSGANSIPLTGPGGATGLSVTAITDDATTTTGMTTTNNENIYAGDATSYVTLDGTTGKKDLHVGGTLTAADVTAGSDIYPDGPYRGVFDIMLHY